ncbi:MULTISPECIES: WG repeat-containing protein [Providencia]|uniref:WG repeat-containing protein n=1 Tax=Providencia stuartii TaxID=588 RepID=A0ABD5LA87_PROST|nr:MULTISPECIES: WG repeat-containing protein [Providencia]ELR5045079.1 WG repeat-containing protein [Providencia rettgeri]ELR5290145.1 WG repeat-containing protein [Providencia stuartii]ELR5293914.1 WG repeat-containing protein [Providencia stuartii]ELZ5940694.1 WG repeat-containing protein [Providencia stuartii]MCK1144115.1 WG repeat-containing protein [Providencia stuartii]
MIKRLIVMLIVIPAISFANSLSEQFAQFLEQPDKPLNCFEADSAYRYCLKNQPKQGVIVIDRQGNEVYQPYYFDNWPDEAQEGVYRIRQGDKIGFADAKTGDIVIAAEYDCAYPFENGIANVGIGCKTETAGEHSWWTGGQWKWIDLNGRTVKPNH